MTDISNWNNLYKIDGGYPCSSNMLYVPKVNPEENIMCMSWNVELGYSNPDVPKPLIDYFYHRELSNLTMFQSFDWCPDLLEIDHKRQLIFIEWNNMTFNKILYGDGDITLYPDYKEQITNIITDIYNFGYYKMAMYPHCFYIKEGKIKTFDYYGCVKREDESINRKIIEDLIGGESKYRFDMATIEGELNFDKFFEYTTTIHLEKSWQNTMFKEIYNKLCGTP